MKCYEPCVTYVVRVHTWVRWGFLLECVGFFTQLHSYAFMIFMHSYSFTRIRLHAADACTTFSVIHVHSSSCIQACCIQSAFSALHSELFKCIPTSSLTHAFTCIPAQTHSVAFYMSFIHSKTHSDAFIRAEC